MNQKIWGPHMWFSLHSITFTYPFHPSDEDKDMIIHFFKSLKYILPCITCQLNYANNLKELPIRANSRKELVHWLIELHNMVNVETGKEIMPPETAIKHYEKIYGCRIYLDAQEQDKDLTNNCMIDNKNYTCYYLFVITILLILSYWFKP